MKSMMIVVKSSEVLIHMSDILQQRMPAGPTATTFTDADFLSPPGTFFDSGCAKAPNADEAWILFERLTFKNNELLLNTSLGFCKKDLSMFRATRKQVCYAMRRLMAWELDYKVGFTNTHTSCHGAFRDVCILGQSKRHEICHPVLHWNRKSVQEKVFEKEAVRSD
jgi:hypothetical protein